MDLPGISDQSIDITTCVLGAGQFKSVGRIFVAVGTWGPNQ